MGQRLRAIRLCPKHCGTLKVSTPAVNRDFGWFDSNSHSLCDPGACKNPLTNGQLTGVGTVAQLGEHREAPGGRRFEPSLYPLW